MYLIHFFIIIEGKCYPIQKEVFKLFEWIAKYWLEVLFTLICSGAAFVIRHHVKLIISEKKRNENDTLKAIDEKFKEQNINMEKKMEECYGRVINVVQNLEQKSNKADGEVNKKIGTITNGILSIEGAYFKQECRKMLDPEHIITTHEYEMLVVEHGTYNSLGGNHEGDKLFRLVEAKY